MANKALYILAGYDNETEAHLSNIQNKLYELGFIGTQTKNIPQHITLGAFSTNCESKLIDSLKTLAKTTAPIYITFNHVGIFGGSKVLFIAPDCSEELLKLKENFGSSYNWTPHTTMLVDTPDMIYRALPTVMEQFSAFSGKITTLHLYEFFPTRHILSVTLES